ncbi:MAG: maleylpyruvate isomerase N-terminal domain-containing protein, partial [Chloroflexota bacterium]
MVATLNTLTVDAQNAHEIPGPDHAEAGRLAQTEYQRVLAVLESLEGDDWSQQTYCTEWDVRDMAAHLAGSVTASTSPAQFRHVYMSNPYLKEMEEPADAANRLQVE